MSFANPLLGLEGSGGERTPLNKKQRVSAGMGTMSAERSRGDTDCGYSRE